MCDKKDDYTMCDKKDDYTMCDKKDDYTICDKKDDDILMFQSRTIHRKVCNARRLANGTKWKTRCGNRGERQGTQYISSN